MQSLAYRLILAAPDDDTEYLPLIEQTLALAFPGVQVYVEAAR